MLNMVAIIVLIFAIIITLRGRSKKIWIMHYYLLFEWTCRVFGIIVACYGAFWVIDATRDSMKVFGLYITLAGLALILIVQLASELVWSIKKQKEHIKMIEGRIFGQGQQVDPKDRGSD